MVFVGRSFGQELTPPLFNLAAGRRVTASATCGEGVEEPELYCNLVGANNQGNDIKEEEEHLLIGGQVSHISGTFLILYLLQVR